MYKKYFSLLLITTTCLVGSELTKISSTNEDPCEMVTLGTGYQVPRQEAEDLIKKCTKMWEEAGDEAITTLCDVTGLAFKCTNDKKEMELFKKYGLAQQETAHSVLLRNHSSRVFVSLFKRVGLSWRLRDPYEPLFVTLKNGASIRVKEYDISISNLRHFLSKPVSVRALCYLSSKAWLGDDVTIPNREIQLNAADEKKVNPYQCLLNGGLITESGELLPGVAELCKNIFTGGIAWERLDNPLSLDNSLQ